MKTEDVLKMHPLERAIDLQGATVIVIFKNRAEVLQHWNDIRPLLHSMSREHRPRYWKVDKQLRQITLVLQIQDGREVRVCDADFEIERLEDICSMVGIDRVEVIKEDEDV